MIKGCTPARPSTIGGMLGGILMKKTSFGLNANKKRLNRKFSKNKHKEKRSAIVRKSSNFGREQFVKNVNSKNSNFGRTKFGYDTPPKTGGSPKTDSTTMGPIMGGGGAGGSTIIQAPPAIVMP
jgi:hypothetical protein